MMLYREIENLKCYGDEVERIFETWEYIKDIKGYFFHDLIHVDSRKDFERFCIENILDCFFVVRENKIIYVSYIVISGYKSVAYVAYSNRVDNNLKLTKKLNDMAIKYYVSNWNINRFDIYVNLENRVSNIIIRKLGFVFKCRIPKLFLIGGIATDYNYYTLEV